MNYSAPNLSQALLQTTASYELYRGDALALSSLAREISISYLYDTTAVLMLLKKMHEQDVPATQKTIASIKATIKVMNLNEMQSTIYNQLQNAADSMTSFYKNVQIRVKTELHHLLVYSSSAYYLNEQDICHIQILTEHTVSYAKSIQSLIFDVLGSGKDTYVSIYSEPVEKSLQRLTEDLTEFLRTQNETLISLEHIKNRLLQQNELTKSN